MLKPGRLMLRPAKLKLKPAKLKLKPARLKLKLTLPSYTFIEDSFNLRYVVLYSLAQQSCMLHMAVA